MESGASIRMISKKDMNDAEIITLTKQCSPTIVIIVTGEVQTHEEATMKTDILMNGSMYKNHISLKTGFGYPATRRTLFLLWFLACQIDLQDLIINFKDTFKTGESMLNIFFKLVFITYSKWYQDSRTRGSNWKWHLSSDCVNYGWWEIGESRFWSSQ